MNVLVVAPHPDDESIGCGGAVHLHLKRNDRTTVVFLTSGEKGLPGTPIEEVIRVREAEARKAGAVLGVTEVSFLRHPDGALEQHAEQVAKNLRGHIEREKPELIYLPHPGEWHPDHRASFSIACEALQGIGFSPRIFGYEIWTPLTYYHCVQDISDVFSIKLSAIHCYASQLAGLDYDKAIAGLNQYRGAIALRRPYAEVFQELRCH